MKTTKLFVILSFFAFLNFNCTNDQSDEVYVFSYFTGNGEDGLHLSYSLDGLNWETLQEGKSFLTPTAGDDKLMRDPCIIKGGDGLYHMVWTVSWNEKGLGYASSPDLIHWSKQMTIPVMAHEAGARNTWAPEIFYNEEEAYYMIFWSTTIEGKYLETQSKEESGYNHRKYYTTTKDFVEFTPTELLYEPGFNVIDGSIIKENGEYIMFVKDETREPAQKNIRITRSKSLTGGYGSASEPITGDYWAEGPTVAKVGDQWIVYFDKYTEKKMGAVASKDLVNWTDISDQVNFPKGTRHGTVFKISMEELEKLKKAVL
ncbi:glycoside hydrolase family 43 protein [Belliella sp. R4-6]|uniref:Glycoside hydrolase family 43 protein n=1 Tax=Belliella alkalica TaxID=1730871 RepID=A0ABS9VDN3_9BACT|nr:glycoside hydrolase family 43 protein [Belliella alkalica]MCH7414545.1 glycoside hydrolase family 43 protein [Belliella alkalica]